MAQKKKKQHYVPQFYLNAWSIPDSHQTHVYDRISDTRRISNIEDVAMENGFYNIIPMEVLPRDVISRFREQGLELDFESQGVENAFLKR